MAAATKGTLSMMEEHAKRYPDIDMAFAVNQIIARRHIKEKLPLWYHNRNLVFPWANRRLLLSERLAGSM